MNSTEHLKSVIFNITIAFYQFTLNTLYEEVDGEIRFTAKALKDLPEMYSRYTKSRIKLKVVEEGQWGVWKEGVGYTDGMLGALQNNEANKPFFPVPLDTKDPPGVFTAAIEENTYHLISITQKSIPHSSLYGVLFKAVQAILTGHIFGSSKTFFLLTFACLLTALFGAIINASFNTSAIVRSTKEQVKSLSDIIKMNKNPWFFDGLSQYELFEAGVTPEFKQVYKHAEKKGLATAKPLVESTTSLLSRDWCLNAVALTTLRATEFIKIYFEYLCSSELGSPQNVFISNPYHKALRVSLFNPCTDGLIAEEMIRRDEAFNLRAILLAYSIAYSVLLEAGINFHGLEILKKFVIKSTSTLSSLKTGSPTDDSDLYSLSASPLKFSNFKDLLLLQFFTAVIAAFIEFGSQIYHRCDRLNLKFVATEI
uniref:Ionotropic glutamate receptor C-terminal domain-containing protein n=1 Tax=Tetranychus urticae TaxID=32264 RepID=T1L3Q7_TETUR